MKLRCSGCSELFQPRDKRNIFCNKDCWRKYYNTKNEIRIKRKQSERGKRYYQENKDKMIAKHREYNSINAGKIRERQKVYYNKNKDWLIPLIKEHHRNNRANKAKIYSQEKYGIYAEAHRALLNLETQTRERKDGT